MYSQGGRRRARPPSAGHGGWVSEEPLARSARSGRLRFYGSRILRHHLDPGENEQSCVTKVPGWLRKCVFLTSRLLAFF